VPRKQAPPPPPQQFPGWGQAGRCESSIRRPSRSVALKTVARARYVYSAACVSCTARPKGAGGPRSAPKGTTTLLAPGPPQPPHPRPMHAQGCGDDLTPQPQNKLRVWEVCIARAEGWVCAGGGVESGGAWGDPNTPTAPPPTHPSDTCRLWPRPLTRPTEQSAHNARVCAAATCADGARGGFHTT
jgi:hypothetical protein